LVSSVFNHLAGDPLRQMKKPAIKRAHISIIAIAAK
jgi:hypothetical protein